MSELIIIILLVIRNVLIIFLIYMLYHRIKMWYKTRRFFNLTYKTDIIVEPLKPGDAVIHYKDTFNETINIENDSNVAFLEINNPLEKGLKSPLYTEDPFIIKIMEILDKEGISEKIDFDKDFIVRLEWKDGLFKKTQRTYFIQKVYGNEQ